MSNSPYKSLFIVGVDAQDDGTLANGEIEWMETKLKEHYGCVPTYEIRIGGNKHYMTPIERVLENGGEC